jgi:putative intracellular protease/amidase
VAPASQKQRFQAFRKELLMKTKVLFALTNHDRKGNTGQATGFYLPEAAHPYAVLAAAGVDIEFVSPKGGKAPPDGVDLSDPLNRAFLENAQIKHNIDNTRRPSQVSAGDYAAILFVGGHGTMWDFPNDAGLARLAAQIYESGGVVGAVCHGPAALVNLQLSDGSYLVAGKRVAAFTDDEERAVQLDKVVPFLLASTLQQRGARHVAADNWQANVVVDGRLVTGQNPASATGVGQEMLKLIKQAVTH